MEEKCNSEPDGASKSSGLLQFMMLVGQLKNVRRTGWVIRGIQNCESVADHMFRMGVLAFLLDREKTEGLDRDRCVKIALVHDLAECIVGDITPWCGVSVEEKHRREKEAMRHMCGLLDKETGDEIMSLYEEYEQQATPEAKAVKDLDRFDMLLQAYEYEKALQQPYRLQDFFDHTLGKFQNPNVLKWVDELNQMRDTPL